jgi:hypothetical protein
MAVTHPTAVRNAIADLVVDRVDAGAGAGYMEFQTSGGVEVATCVMSDPAFAAASSGQAVANAINNDASATGGTMAKCVVKDSTGTEVFQFVVGTGGSGDLNLSNLVIGAGDQVSVSNFTYVAPL